MSMQRREFLLSSTAMAAGLAATSDIQGQTIPKPKRQAALKLSSQLRVIPGKSLDKKLATMKEWGFDAFELPRNIVGQEKMYEEAAAKSGLAMSAVCWGSHDGALVSEDPTRRKECMAAIKEVLASAGQLKSTGVIYVPAFNGQTKLRNIEIRKVLTDTFPALGEYAVSVGSRILFEPLNRKEAFFLRILADAASICRDIASPGVQMMGDFYHMAIEETSDMGAFISAGAYLHHVHLASRIRVLPGQDDRQFVDGFRGLKLIGFQEYCSFECGVKGDRSVEIPKSLAFLRRQWAEA